MYHHYTSPPPRWSAYDYTTSPPPSPHYSYYASQYAAPSPRHTPKRHSRKSSYASPHESGWYYAYTHNAEPEYVSPRKHEHVRASYEDGKYTEKASTDYRRFTRQVPTYEEDSPKRSRSRRASTATRPSPSKPKASPPKSRKATEEDARRCGIPTGYSIKNWDPNETPIILLGSVFDANSLGKWIYDWTVHYYGAEHPMADVAGELWLLLIRLSGKVKIANECLDRVHKPEYRDLLHDFLASGERLLTRFKTLLKECEHYMWKAAKRESGGRQPVSMGPQAGCEFVLSIFGRDRKLPDTEQLMNSIRIWDMRFDANCEAILRPSRRRSAV